ncbi:MAG: serine/threonine-protein kinase [Polyangiaceae bacterium]
MTAAVAHNTSNLAPGYKLDRYELLCPIAEGGMASVWVARQRGKHGFEKLVAIKTILPVFASDVRFQAMFLDEARIASKIEHINVAQILDLGEEHDVLYLAMEYVDGDALSKLNHACQKEGSRIPPGILLRILADTCAGLHEAHEMFDAGRPLEIVHRDVSPHNILVNSRGIAKLIDFGIAKARSRAGGETNSGVLKGKIQYMAPEQALGRNVDRRADIWAVGVILYYLLSGKPPYEAENQLATLHLLASGRPPMPLPLTVHSAISSVVRKALAYAPENRYQTAAELREALERAMIDAHIATTQADVAAFTGKHLADRAEKRKQAIDLALAAAAERRRVAELLKPAGETSSSGLTPPPSEGGIRVAPPPSSNANLSPQEATRAETPGPKRPPIISELSPNSRSYETLGSAALDASEPLPFKSRKPFAVVVMLGIVAAAVVLLFAYVRPKPVPRATGAQPMEAPPQPAPGPAPAPPQTATVVDSTAGVNIPVISASALPKVKEPTPPPTPRWTSPPAPAAAPSPPTTPASKPKPKTVDDGF